MRNHKITQGQPALLRKPSLKQISKQNKSFHEEEDRSAHTKSTNQNLFWVLAVSKAGEGKRF